MNKTDFIIIEQNLDFGKITSSLCQCSCGKKFIVSNYLLKRGKVKSCGCLNLKQVDKNLKKTKEYKLWMSIKRRCRDKKYSKYEEYGGKGIDIDESWFNNFEEFHKEIGDYPEGLTLTLKEAQKGYCKGNCEWVYMPKN